MSRPGSLQREGEVSLRLQTDLLSRARRSSREWDDWRAPDARRQPASIPRLGAEPHAQLQGERHRNRLRPPTPGRGTRREVTIVGQPEPDDQVIAKVVPLGDLGEQPPAYLHLRAEAAGTAAA